MSCASSITAKSKGVFPDLVKKEAKSVNILDAVIWFLAVKAPPMEIS